MRTTTSVSLPQGLKDRMDAAGEVNWSSVAAKAFEVTIKCGADVILVPLKSDDLDALMVLAMEAYERAVQWSNAVKEEDEARNWRRECNRLKALNRSLCRALSASVRARN